jgi:hypothetical protein
LDDELGWGVEVRKGKHATTFTGSEAQRAAGLIMPAVNAGGGRRGVVQQAVAHIEEVGRPEAFILEATRYRAKGGAIHHPEPGAVTRLPHPMRLALEMALHEEQEMRALQGELWRLERAWREAEEIAAIADDLLLPEGAEDFIEKHRPE